jgi:hypothetical protein
MAYLTDLEFNLAASRLQPVWTDKDVLDAINFNPVYSKGYSLPDHYLVPLSVDQIVRYAKLLGIKGMLTCPLNEDRRNCQMTNAIAVSGVEFVNLCYVNGLVTWEKVQQIYKETQKFLEALPTPLPSFKEQLKNSLTVGVSMIVGLITAGPIGFFTGSAAATGKIIEAERAKKMAAINGKMDAMIQNIPGAMEAREQIAKAQQVTSMATIAIVGLTAGAVIYFITD